VCDKYHALERIKMHTKCLSENLKQSAHMGKLGTHKMNVKEQVIRM
jgi:hypothetical protein